MEVGGMPEKMVPSDSIFCVKTNREITLLTNEMKDFLDCFSFTLIRKGECTLLYNGHTIKLSKDDLYIYTPGLTIEVTDISEDYEGICLIVDKNILFENSISHDVITAAYFPIMSLPEPKIHLDEKAVYRVNGEMNEIIMFLNSDRRLKTEASLIIFSLMLIDVTEFLERPGQYVEYSPKEETLLVEFMRLVSLYFKKERNIGFYSDALGISSAYLSKIIKSNSGKTVMGHINDMLLKEAVWALKSSDKPIKRIAEELNFADQASFNKFFRRMKGCSPTEFRNRASSAV